MTQGGSKGPRGSSHLSFSPKTVRPRPDQFRSFCLSFLLGGFFFVLIPKRRKVSRGEAFDVSLETEEGSPEGATVKRGVEVAVVGGGGVVSEAVCTVVGEEDGCWSFGLWQPTIKLRRLPSNKVRHVDISDSSHPILGSLLLAKNNLDTKKRLAETGASNTTRSHRLEYVYETSDIRSMDRPAIHRHEFGRTFGRQTPQKPPGGVL